LATSQQLRPLAGKWAGVIETYEGLIPIGLQIDGDGGACLRVGRQPEAVLEDGRFTAGWLEALFDAQVPIADTLRRAHKLRLVAHSEDRRLRGVAVALSHFDEPDLAARGQRCGNALAHWTSLERSR
jgi:hypothetical protein